MNMYFQNENKMTTSPAKRLWENLCIKFTKVWFNSTPNNKSQKQTVHINIIFCEFRLLHWLFVLHPRNTELFMATSFILFKLAIHNPNVCYSFFIMGSPTCNGITCIMHIVLSYLFFQNKICTCNSKDNNCLPRCKWITCKCTKWC